MNPLNLDGMSQFLGPGLGGLWAGEQQGLAVDAEKLKQQKTLEEIAASKQNQDIARQKLPFELQEMEARVGQTKANTAQTTQNTEVTAEKLKKDKFSAFVKELAGMDPRTVSMEDRAAFLNDVSKRHGVPIDHPMYGIALRAHAQGGDAWDKFSQAFAVDPETRFKESQANARTERSNQRMEDNTRLIQETQERIRREDREAKIRIAEMRLQEAQKAVQAKNYMMAAMHFRAAAQAAEQANEVEKARELYNESFRYEQLDRARNPAAAMPGKQPYELPAEAGLRRAPAAPTPGPGPAGGFSAQGPASSVPSAPVVKWGKDANGNPIRIQ